MQSVEFGRFPIWTNILDQSGPILISMFPLAQEVACSTNIQSIGPFQKPILRLIFFNIGSPGNCQSDAALLRVSLDWNGFLNHNLLQRLCGCTVVQSLWVVGGCHCHRRPIARSVLFIRLNSLTGDFGLGLGLFSFFFGDIADGTEVQKMSKAQQDDKNTFEPKETTQSIER